jgi:hypothetical protein
MKSGLRGGKPRDMATFKKGGMKPKVSKEIEMPLPGGGSMEMEMPMRKMAKGGMTSRGAGAAQRGYDYNIYAKGGKVKKYAEGGDTGFNPSNSGGEGGIREYTFADIKRFFGGKSEEPKATPKAAPKAAEDEGTPNSRERISGVPVLQGVDTAAPPVRRPTQQQQRMARRAAPGPGFLPSDQAVTGPARSRIPRPMSDAEREAEQPDLSPRPRISARAEPSSRSEFMPEPRSSSDYTPEPMSPGFRPPSYRAPGSGTGGMSEADIMRASRAAQAPYSRSPRAPESEVMRTLRRAIHGDERAREMEARGYAKGGSVKMAGGGSCRGMGAATRGGKYKIK